MELSNWNMYNKLKESNSQRKIIIVNNFQVICFPTYIKLPWKRLLYISSESSGKIQNSSVPLRSNYNGTVWNGNFGNKDEWETGLYAFLWNQSAYDVRADKDGGMGKILYILVCGMGSRSTASFGFEAELHWSQDGW